MIVSLKVRFFKRAFYSWDDTCRTRLYDWVFPGEKLCPNTFMPLKIDYRLRLGLQHRLTAMADELNNFYAN